MRIVVTNINPQPVRFDWGLAPSSRWYAICTSCRSVDELGDFTIEAECEQHATDYALRHAQLAHRGETLSLLIEHQLVLEFPGVRSEPLHSEQ